MAVVAVAMAVLLALVLVAVELWEKALMEIALQEMVATVVKVKY
jgi:hypothetical protein